MATTVLKSLKNVRSELEKLAKKLAIAKKKRTNPSSKKKRPRVR